MSADWIVRFENQFYRAAEPVSLAPLSFDDAVVGMLATKAARKVG